MNQKLKFILVVCFVSILGTFANAQTKNTQDKDDQEAKNRVLELKKSLNLTPEQVLKVKALFSELKNKRQDLTKKFEKSKDLSVEKKQIVLNEIKAFKQEQKTRITQILTEDQIKKFEELIQIKKLQ